MISLGARTTLALGIHTAHAAGARLHLACEIAGIACPPCSAGRPAKASQRAMAGPGRYALYLRTR